MILYSYQNVTDYYTKHCRCDDKKYQDTHKEQIKVYDVQYREVNKDKIKEIEKEYIEANTEKIYAKRSERITCECGCTSRRDNADKISQHKKSLCHQNFIEEKKKLKLNLADEELNAFFRTSYQFQNCPKGILITSYINFSRIWYSPSSTQLPFILSYTILK